MADLIWPQSDLSRPRGFELSLRLFGSSGREAASGSVVGDSAAVGGDVFVRGSR